MEKSEILSQSPNSIARLKRYRWLLGLGGIASALGMAAAIAVVPNEEYPIGATAVLDKLTVEGARPVELGDTLFLREERVQRGDTLGDILARLGVHDTNAQEFIRASPGTRAMHQQLAPGKILTAQTAENGELQRLYFPLNGKDSALVVERSNTGFSVKEAALRFESLVAMKTAEIRTSLFGATDAAGIPDGVAIQLADIFGGDIDFHRDLRKNDRFSVVYEMLHLSGQPVRPGRVLAAEFVNNGKVFRAIHFEREGRSSYYTPEGKNLRKAFFRSPLELSRVTSGFAMRFHPVLQQWRAHKGVDYGAPSGTRVRSTGDGIVDFAGQQGGYGKLLVIRHSDKYTTAYGHLKGFAPGIKKGTRVSQGDNIGYVGQSGWATGPHLHYEFRINSQQVNPLSLNLPTAMPLAPSELTRFKSAATPLAARLDLLRHTNLAAFD